jgi:hypothetical protein
MIVAGEVLFRAQCPVADQSIFELSACGTSSNELCIGFSSPAGALSVGGTFSCSAGKFRSPRWHERDLECALKGAPGRRRRPSARLTSARGVRRSSGNAGSAPEADEMTTMKEGKCSCPISTR